MKLNHNIICAALSKQGQADDLKMVFQNINQEHKEKLLDYITNWNTNGKHCLAAQVFTILKIFYRKLFLFIFIFNHLLQLVLNILLEDIMVGKLIISQEKLQGLMAYSERHYRRLTTLKTNIQFLCYTTNCMAPHSSKLLP